MTFGTPTNLGYSQPHRSCALTSSLVVVVREDQSNSSRLTVRAATVSGTTMSWGTEVYDNSYQTISYYNIKRLTDNSFVISFTCNTYTYCVIGTVSGNTITLGAPQQLGADYRGSWALGRLSDTSFVFNTYKNSTSKSYLCIASVSGTTISYGTPYDVSATLGYDQYRYCKDIVGLSSTTFAICGANAAYDKSGVLVVTFSGTTISSLGTFYDYEPVVGAYTSMILIDTNKLLISYQDSGNSNYSKLVIATNSSGTISFGTIYSLRVAYGNFYVAPVDITHFRLAYQGASNSSQTRSGTISGTTITGLDDAEEYNADNRQGQFICSLSSTLFALSYQEPGANGYILIGNNVVAPTVTTQAATDVADTSCTGNGNITSNGGGVITEKGICYKVGTTGDPTTADSTVHDHTDSTGAFTEAITGLTANTGYRMRAYAINSAGTSYGETVQVTTTTVAPTVSTQAATDIDNTSITGNGNITATGGANATRRGFCYKTGTTGDPTTADTVAYDDGDFGTGAYTKSITSLTSKSYYRVRAYAVNSEGTSYGTTIQANTFKFTFGAETVFYDGTVYVDKISTCYLDSTHVVVAYVNNEDHGYARIGVITGNEVVFGDPYEFIDDASNYTSVSALDSTHFVVGFRHTDVDGYCKIGTVSNDDEIAYGSEYEFLNEDVSNFSVAGLDSTHFVVGYIDASNQGRAKVGTVSNGNEIAYGTSAFSTSNFNVTGVCKLDSTHFAIIGNGVVNNYGLCDVGTVSGDSITFAGYQTFDNTGSVITFNCSAITSTYFAIAYTVDGHGYIKICRASTVGSAYEFNNATSSFINVVALDENLITIVYQDNNVGYVLIGYVSNNTELYFGEKKIFNNASSVGNVITILSSTKIAISFRDDGDSSKGKTMIGS
ncbi:hypothetical protein M0R01_05030, partial [bacterium]|nr:hypothetical protein [bacterium]